MNQIWTILVEFGCDNPDLYERLFAEMQEQRHSAYAEGYIKAQEELKSALDKLDRGV